MKRAKRFNRDVEHSGTVTTSRPEGTSWNCSDGRVEKMEARSCRASTTARTQLYGKDREKEEMP